jgi:hypothetical protein
MHVSTAEACLNWPLHNDDAWQLARHLLQHLLVLLQ